MASGLTLYLSAKRVTLRLSTVGILSRSDFINRVRINNSAAKRFAVISSQFTPEADSSTRLQLIRKSLSTGSAMPE